MASTGSRRLGGAGLVRQIGAVTTMVALVVVVISGLVAIGLIRVAAHNQLRRSLAVQADVALESIEGRGGRVVVQTQQEIAALRKAGVSAQRISGRNPPRGVGLIGRVVGARFDQISRNQRYGYQLEVDGRQYFVETRRLQNGDILVLAMPASSAESLTQVMVMRTLLALAAGLLVSIAAGWLLARRIANPLRQTAAAADQMATGSRDVRVEPAGPKEVAAVAHSLNTLQAALVASEARQRASLMSVSHEFRTPLTAIKGFSEALADGVATERDSVAAGRTIAAEADRLTRLVGDLLDLARLGAVDFRIQVRPVDLTDLVDRAAAVWGPRCRAAGVRFEGQLPRTPLEVRTDAGRVRQVIDNLAENALRVTPEGELIRFVLADSAGGGAVLQVRDSGPGLTPADCEDAFGRAVLYERYRGVRRVGTGVGLALVDGLTRRLGGRAEASRSPEGGACFSIWLPAEAPTTMRPEPLPVPPPAAQRQAPPQAPAPPSSADS